MTRDEEALRRALEAALEVEAERVEVQPGALDTIRHRVEARRARWWLPVPVGSRPGARAAVGASTFAGVAAVMTAVVLAFAGCLPRSPGPAPGTGTTAEGPAGPAASGSADGGPAGSGSARSGSAPADDTAPTGGAASATAGPSGTSSSAVYYLARDPRRGYLLYREFHQLPVTGGDGLAVRITASLTEMLRPGSHVDPDYTGLWPRTARVLDVRVEGGVATVNLTGAASGPAADAGPALQQLVWTVTAVSRDVTGVRLRFDGAPVDRLWGAVDVGTPVRRAPAVDVLAPVWLIEPQEGAAVGGTFAVHVAGIVYEATAQLRVRDQAGRTVHQQVLTLSAGPPAQGQIEVTVRGVAPGRYTVEAFYYSAEDGSVRGMDDKSITVR